MIVNKGRELIARYMAGRGGSWAGAIELGVGTTAVVQTDESLEFPVIRIPVEYMDYNPSTYDVILRGTLPEITEGEFHEVAVFSDEDFPEGEQGNLLLLDFSDEDTVYSVTNAATTVENARVGSTSYKLTAPAAGNSTLRAFLPQAGGDLKVYTGNDVLNLAYFYAATGGTPSVNIRFESSQSDYYEHTFTPTAGYNIESTDRQSLSQTGSPSWDTVNAVYIELTDQGELTLDGLSIEDTINIGTYGMILRRILGTPLVKSVGSETEVTVTFNLGF